MDSEKDIKDHVYKCTGSYVTLGMWVTPQGPPLFMLFLPFFKIGQNFAIDHAMSNTIQTFAERVSPGTELKTSAC